MLPSQHVFSHQHQYPPSDWQHHAPHHGLQNQHSAAQGYAAAAQAAQQQHYGRIAAANQQNNMGPGGAEHNQQALAAPGEGVSDENRRVLEQIAQMMNPNTRESALLELSKKREQVPELALILWHSFGGSFFS